MPPLDWFQFSFVEASAGGRRNIPLPLQWTMLARYKVINSHTERWVLRYLNYENITFGMSGIKKSFVMIVVVVVVVVMLIMMKTVMTTQLLREENNSTVVHISYQGSIVWGCSSQLHPSQVRSFRHRQRYHHLQQHNCRNSMHSWFRTIDTTAQLHQKNTLDARAFMILQ